MKKFLKSLLCLSLLAGTFATNLLQPVQVNAVEPRVPLMEKRFDNGKLVYAPIQLPGYGEQGAPIMVVGDCTIANYTTSSAYLYNSNLKVSLHNSISYKKGEQALYSLRLLKTELGANRTKVVVKVTLEVKLIKDSKISDVVVATCEI